MPPPLSLTFDWAYSHALLHAAVEADEVVAIGDQTSLPKEVVSLLLGTRVSRPLRRKALEMAVFAEEIHLAGVPSGFDTSRFRSAIPGLEFSRMGSFEDVPTVPVELASGYKQLIIRRTHRDINLLLSGLGLPPAPHHVISTIYDWIVRVCGVDIDLRDFILGADQFGRAPSEEGDEIALIFVEMITRVPGIDPRDRASVEQARTMILGIASDLLGFHSLLMLSKATGWPVLTDRISAFRGLVPPSASNLQETVSVCQVAFEKAIGYAPVVHDYQDVLRLRERKEIGRFREVLSEWVEIAPQGQEKLLRTVTRDIELANRELCKLDKWRKIEKWTYWLSIPTTFIPILSTVVTVAGVGARWQIERKEDKHNWVAIGR